MLPFRWGLPSINTDSIFLNIALSIRNFAPDGPKIFILAHRRNFTLVAGHCGYHGGVINSVLFRRFDTDGEDYGFL